MHLLNRMFNILNNCPNSVSAIDRTASDVLEVCLSFVSHAICQNVTTIYYLDVSLSHSL